MPHSQVKLRLTKGIHLVIDRTRLPLPSAVVITEGKRILFAIPWGERVILGTTDTDYRGDPEKVATDASDIAYVLRSVNEFFPKLALRESDIVSTWAGLRPLVANHDGTPSDTSRAHEITSPETGWWDITGGKLTTYRLMAEQAVDKVVSHLGARVAPCRTAKEPLLPAPEVTPYSGILPAPYTREAVEHYVGREWAHPPAGRHPAPQRLVLLRARFRRETRRGRRLDGRRRRLERGKARRRTRRLPRRDRAVGANGECRLTARAAAITSATRAAPTHAFPPRTGRARGSHGRTRTAKSHRRSAPRA
jgi:hypothetical protein